MSLRVLDLEQGSDEWLAARAGMVTASVVGRLITARTLKPADNDTSRALVAELVAERITGHVDSSYVSADMWRGVEFEPVARDLYAEHYAPVREVGFMVRDDWGFSIGYSPDGLVGGDGLIEIKCPRPKNHLRTILDDKVPGQYMPQLQAGLLVSGRDWCDFVSYSGGLPLFVKRVYADPNWGHAIVSTVAKFESDASNMVGSFDAATASMPATERIELEMTL